MVVFLLNSPSSALVLSVQPDCIDQICCMADACAPDLKMNSVNQKGRGGFWKKQKVLT